MKFEIECPTEIEVEDCNCSICSKTGFLHLILPLSKFTLLEGSENLETYTFNTGVAKHTFCKVCGVKPFYTPRSNPDGIDVNVRCLDTRPDKINVVKFNGRAWEDNAHKLSHKSRDL
ncbi:MAG: GFA family protein [Cyanobacteria bacterium P01_F01_bin.42]